jgi:hypothetical protein
LVPLNEQQSPRASVYIEDHGFTGFTAAELEEFKQKGVATVTLYRDGNKKEELSLPQLPLAPPPLTSSSWGTGAVMLLVFLMLLLFPLSRTGTR